MELTEKDLEKFIEIACQCFQKLAPGMSAFVPNEPVIALNQTDFFDFTGVIELSQKGEQGKICLTMPESMIHELLGELGEDQRTEETSLDLIGELASIISSNAREHFGSTLGISIPQSLTQSQTAGLQLAPMRFILPLSRNNLTSHLVIALGSPQPSA
ncbi:MAG: chemotaxis protein CheX [Verrucomicrobiota bacterium]